MQSIFTWNDFDKAVEFIANKCNLSKFSGVYGIPRGGICLAVALSHKLKIKFLSEPIENSLIVDDIYDTGVTLSAFKDIKGSTYFVLFSKKSPVWWNTVSMAETNEWIVFPWEDKLYANNDQKEFLNKRRRN